MGRKLRHVLIFLLIILKEPNIPEADCSCIPKLQFIRLDLQNNNLSSIPLTLLSMGAIELGGNPWQCDCSVCGSVAGIVVIGITIWYKIRARHPLLGLNPNAVFGNKTTATETVSDDDHQYEQVDNRHDQTRQRQSQAITESNTNTTETVMTSADDHKGQGQYQDLIKVNTNAKAIVMTCGRDQTGQGQSQTSVDDRQYEDTDAPRVNTRRAKFQAIAESNIKTTATVMSSGQDQTGQGQSQAIVESNTNTIATVSTSGDDQTGQGQGQAVTESFDVRNLFYGTEPTASEHNCVYKAVTQSQTITNTAVVMTSGHDQTRQSQYVAIAESLDERNISYCTTGLTASQLNSQYKTATVMTSGHDKTRHGQSQTNTGSTTNPTATVMTSGHDQTGQGQSQANTGSNTNTTATVMTSGHDQTGQGQSQANIQSLKVGNLSHNEVLAALKPNPMYVDVKTPPKDDASTEMACIHDQTKQDQSQANIQSLKVENSSHNEVLAALQPNPMYTDVRTSPKDEASTEMACIHDQTKQNQSQANIQSLKVGNLSHNEVLAALKPNPMYTDVRTSPKDEASTEMACIHDHTGQDQSQANIQSLKVENLSHNEVLAALKPNPMYTDVKTLSKDEASTEMASIYDLTEQNQSQTNTQSPTVANLSRNEVLAALQPNPMYTDVGTPPKNPASTEVISQPREECDKMDVSAWHMGLVIPEVYIKISQHLYQKR
ncbi:Bax inhibitor 1 [Branchiostoma belcheri]|nr:Bax inhibitor 1 [Branchiostoma belcheri]